MKRKKFGVVSPSSGNHAQGVAYSAKKLNISSKIIMPENCNPVKLKRVKSFGADVTLIGTIS